MTKAPNQKGKMVQVIGDRTCTFLNQGCTCPTFSVPILIPISVPGLYISVDT